ncbi:MAG TPA: LysE family transporter [Firmicutes bacterium]|nr:LysE family transporter [Bacillota bacterium]
MESWSLFVTSFLVGLSGAVMPGPLVTVAIAGVGRIGGFSGLAASVGHGIPEAILVIALAFGFGDVLRIPLITGLIAIIGGLILAWMAVGMFRSAGTLEIAPMAVAGAHAAITRATATGTTAAGIGATRSRGGTTSGTTRGNIRGNISGSTGRTITGGTGVITRGTVRETRTLRTALPTLAAGVVASVSNPYWILWWTTIGASYISQALKIGWTGLSIFFGGHILSDILWLTFVSCAVATGSSFLSRSFYTRLIQVLAGMLFLMAILFLFMGFKTLNPIHG